MPRMTLLDMTQNILSAMDSDHVNSISDTVESLQVAEVIRETFYEVFADLAIPSDEGLIQLDGLSNVDLPNYLQLPSDVIHIDWIKYNWRSDGSTDYRDVTFLNAQDFLKLVMSSVVQSNSIIVTDPTGVRFSVKTNSCPTWWTTFDNKIAVFDSFNIDLESTLQASMSMCWGQRDVTFPLTDESVPPLDPNLFPLLLAEAKSVCFVNFKQVSSSKEEQRATRQRMRFQNDLWRMGHRDYTGPNYGRPTRGQKVMPRRNGIM